jgi:hypothetical protein
MSLESFTAETTEALAPIMPATRPMISSPDMALMEAIGFFCLQCVRRNESMAVAWMEMREGSAIHFEKDSLDETQSFQEIISASEPGQRKRHTAF